MIIVQTIVNGEELCIRVCYSFFLFVFYAKSATTNNHRTRLSVISYQSPFSLDPNYLNKFPRSFLNVEKNWFEIFDFLT